MSSYVSSRGKSIFWFLFNSLFISKKKLKFFENFF